MNLILQLLDLLSTTLLPFSDGSSKVNERYAWSKLQWSCFVFYFFLIPLKLVQVRTKKRGPNLLIEKCISLRCAQFWAAEFKEASVCDQKCGNVQLWRLGSTFSTHCESALWDPKLKSVCSCLELLKHLLLKTAFRFSSRIENMQQVLLQGLSNHRMLKSHLLLVMKHHNSTLKV